MINSIFLGRRKPILLLLIPLVLSAFTHLWNPIGFPDLFYDEGIYMRRAMHVLDGFGLQERCFYDHPYFGPLFLASSLAVSGYPDSLNPVRDVHTVEILYLVPRVLMGVLAMVDTFLIYKISERCYNRNVAIAASILFAVMPITWVTRRILLDSILLPFLLISIFLAVYTKDSKNKSIPILLSGVCLGLAIFTKIPAFTMIPLVSFLIYRNSNKSLKILGLWLIPVILIPMIWPAQSILLGQFDLWSNDVLWQTGRESGGISQITALFLMFDPVLFILGVTGFVFAAKNRDFLLLLWLIPFLIFLSSIGYVQYFHWIPILPVFCIASAKLIITLTNKFHNKKIPQIFSFSVISAIGIFGLVSTTMLITTNVSSQFEATAFVAKYVEENKSIDGVNKITIVSSPVYSWIFNYIFHDENVFTDYRDLLFYPIQTEKVLLISDPHFRSNINAGEELQTAFERTTEIEKFTGGVLNYDPTKYPYTNMYVNYDGSEIEIRTNNSPIKTELRSSCNVK
ncbi:MAG TPA: glycosyltransferase family 39 protein [Nitrosopumilaceae archaeon]|nr:glycosyltransferase family 39 protein [Nitrosopumilaceae archaeon]